MAMVEGNGCIEGNGVVDDSGGSKARAKVAKRATLRAVALAMMALREMWVVPAEVGQTGNNIDDKCSDGGGGGNNDGCNDVSSSCSNGDGGGKGEGDGGDINGSKRWQQ
jgi:hypothetical protein